MTGASVRLCFPTLAAQGWGTQIHSDVSGGHPPPGDNPSAFGQIVMDLEEGDLWRLGDACLCGKWSDLRCGKFLKYLLALPHVDHADTCVGFGYPMKESAMCTGASRMKSHLLDHLVVLRDGTPGKILLY